MKVPCKFVGLLAKEVILTVEPRLVIVFSGLSPSLSTFGGGKPGEVWDTYTWDEKAGYYKRYGRIHKEEFEGWLTTVNLTMSEVSIEVMPEQPVKTEVIPDYKVSFTVSIPRLRAGIRSENGRS